MLASSKNAKSPLIPTAIVPSAELSDASPASVTREFGKLLELDSRLIVVGDARDNPDDLFDHGLKPKFKISLFDTQYFLTGIQQIPELRFVVGYIVQPRRSRRTGSNRPAFDISARIIYKDLSLVWRTTSHFTFVDNAIWIGKGDIRSRIVGDDEYITSDESTTDVPLEILTALEHLTVKTRRPRQGRKSIDLVLRRARGDRIRPFSDFTNPRRRAFANPRNRINRGRTIARFTRKNDPTSLKIRAGFEPDFSDGIVERSQTRSSMYGGTLNRFRILSENRKIQYFFIAGPHHVWIIPPQALTTELSSFGVRTIDVIADDDLFIPGYEYHYYEDTPNGSQLHSQIPAGFVGETCPSHEDKADASPWLEKIPVIQQFRREILE